MPTRSKRSAPSSDSDGPLRSWLRRRGITLFPFQEETWELVGGGYSGIINAPTGSGKTYAAWLPLFEEWIARYGHAADGGPGPCVLWITPLRALAADLARAIAETAEETGFPLRVGVRTGDTGSAERAKQAKRMPGVLVTTPESLHMMLSQKGYPKLLDSLFAVVVDEWHELLGSKRGVQVELALSRLRALNPSLKVWGISATIGNLDEALEVLTAGRGKRKIVRAEMKREVDVSIVLPDEMERFPWAGHLGVRLLPKVLPILEQSKSTLLFTNTRSHAEIWYQALLDAKPDLAGLMATHHGSLDNKLRAWVEAAIHAEKLKVVVCTSSLDLGVDFRPVETVVQVGSPKSVARFLQRAGRSGHRPGAASKVHFVPTHSLEILEAVALKEAIGKGVIESRPPIVGSTDVLIQYLLTLSVSEGFKPDELFGEVTSTHAYRSLTGEEWRWVLDFITTGGRTLYAYDDYRKVKVEDGVYAMTDPSLVRRHRLSIGTIVSDASLRVKLLRGGHVGTVEESFIARLSPGDSFWLGGKCLELVDIREMTVRVRNSKKKSGLVPRWLGGRLPLSARFAAVLRDRLDRVGEGNLDCPELRHMRPLFELQERWSHIPASDELLVERVKSKEGYHLFFYPFEGRAVHEGLALLVAHRLSKLRPITFSLAMNDYGFELLSDQEVDGVETLQALLFGRGDLAAEVLETVNAAELAKRQFREVARVSCLVFTGFPGKQKADRHLQASAELLYSVFAKYDPENLLLGQARSEVVRRGLEGDRLAAALDRLRSQRMVVTGPEHATPFAFPIMVDRLREKITSERLEDRIRKMQLVLEAAAERGDAKAGPEGKGPAKSRRGR